MDRQEQLIELCKELRLPSIRKMVQEKGNFKQRMKHLKYYYKF